MSTFLLGGRIGDLIHALWVAKNTPGKHDLFITDRRELHSDGFALPLQQTYDELLPILQKQDWFNSLTIFEDKHGYEEGKNLSMWRRYAYSASWTQLLANTFNLTPNGDAWVKVDKHPVWAGNIIIHSSTNELRKGHHWDAVLSMYHGRCIFIGNEDEYKLFNRQIPFYKPVDLMEFFTIINSCKFFIGNQSAPLAIAHSLGAPRLAMLNEIDKIHYVGEEKWHNNFYWIAKETYYFPGLNLEF